MKKLGKIVMTGKPMPEADAWIRERCEVVSWDEPGVMPRPLLLEWLADVLGSIGEGHLINRIDDLRP